MGVNTPWVGTLLHGYLPVRQGSNKNGGVILLYIREDIPTKVLSFETFKNHVQGLSTSLNIYSLQFRHFIILCDFNVEFENSELN